MQLSQNWVGYFNRSYQSIKQGIIQRIPTVVPEITDFNESNPLVVILSFFSGIAEMLGLYIDNMAAEAFVATARRYSSMVKLANDRDYRIKAAIPSQVLLTLSFVDTSGNPVLAINPFVIPNNTICSSPNGNQYRTLEQVIIPLGSSQITVSAEQSVLVSGAILGNTNGVANQVIPAPPGYSEGSMVITINSQNYLPIESLALAQPTDYVFLPKVDTDGLVYFIFGDGAFGVLPPSGFSITGNYSTTAGILGNTQPNTITTIVSSFTLPAGVVLTVTNPSNAYGGSNIESLEQIRLNIPRSLRTLLKAVTDRDYKDLAELYPSVSNAGIQYCCGKNITIHVVPTSPGILTPVFINNMQTYFQNKKIIGRNVYVTPAGLCRIYSEVDVYIKAGYQLPVAWESIIGALSDAYGFGKIGVNGTVKIAEFIKTIATLPEVDDLNFKRLQLDPYAVPQNGTTTILNFQVLAPIITTTQITYLIVYRMGMFDIYKNGLFFTRVGVAIPITDTGIISFQINTGTYLINDTWEFNVYPSFPADFPDYSVTTTEFEMPYIDCVVGNVNSPSTIYSAINLIPLSASSNNPYPLKSC